MEGSYSEESKKVHNIPLALAEQWDEVTSRLRNKIEWVQEGGRKIQLVAAKTNDRVDARLGGEMCDS